MHDFINKHVKLIKANLVNIIFIMLIFVICLWNIRSYERIRAVDEFGYWGIAAVFSGWDWKEVMATSEYYSFGYGFVLVPLFLFARLGVPMAAIYKAAIAMNAFFMVGIYLLVQYIEKEIFANYTKLLSSVTALMITLYIGNTVQMNVAWTEVYLCFIFWCIVATLIRVLKKPSYGNTCLLLLLSANIFAIHMRAIGVAVSVLLVLIIYILTHIKTLDKKYIAYVLGTVIVLVLAVLWMKVFVSNYIYHNSYAEQVVNSLKTENIVSTTSVNDLQSTIRKAKGLLNLEGIFDLLMSVSGKLYYAFSASYLLSAMGFVISVAFVLTGIAKKLRKISSPKWQLMQWVSLFLLLAFCGEILVSAIFKCVHFYEPNVANISTETIVFGRYADFAVGGIMLLGIYGIYNIRRHYREMVISITAFILLAIIVQFQFDILSFFNGKAIATFRGSVAPWFMILADKSIDYFSYYVAIISIGVFSLIVLSGMQGIKRKNVFSLVLIATSVVWGILGISYSKDFNLSKIHKEKNVGTVANIIEVTDEDVPIYWITENYTDSNSDIEILQWSLGNRSIRVRTVPDLETLNLEQAIMICYSGDEDINDVMRTEVENIYSSGTLEVYIEKENENYDFLKKKALEMDYIADQTETTIDLSTAVTELSYLKPNGNLYFNSLSEGNIVKAKLEGLEEGIYEICFDIKAESKDEEGKLGFFILEDAAGNVQNSDPINMEEFEGKKRQNIKREITVREGESPTIGIYVYQNTFVKIYSIKHKKIINRV